MNKHIAIAAAAATVFVAGVARADDSSQRPLTREEVVASVLAARQSGELAVTNAGGTWSGSARAAAPSSRDEVVAGVLAARQSGELAVTNAGGTWSPPAQAAKPGPSRDQVIQELMNARHASNALAIEQSI